MHSSLMKRKPGTAAVKHPPIPELVKALEMPVKKRCRPTNRRRKETMAEKLATGWPGKSTR